MTWHSLNPTVTLNNSSCGPKIQISPGRWHGGVQVLEEGAQQAPGAPAQTLFLAGLGDRPAGVLSLLLRGGVRLPAGLLHERHQPRHPAVPGQCRGWVLGGGSSQQSVWGCAKSSEHEGSAGAARRQDREGWAVLASLHCPVFCLARSHPWEAARMGHKEVISPGLAPPGSWGDAPGGAPGPGHQEGAASCLGTLPVHRLQLSPVA